MVPEFFAFHVKTRVLYGAGQLAELGEHLDSMSARRWLVVTDKVLAGLGFVDKVKAGFESGEGAVAAVFDGVEPNSETAQVEAGARVGKDAGCDGVIGLGGGSALDTAKAIAILLAHEGALLDFQGAQSLPGPVAPLVAIPTTAGTGSEVTNCAVVLDEASQTKVTFLDDHLLPDVALLDPDLTAGLPPRVAAATGMDALTHAVEAYVDQQHQPFSDALALEAVGLIDRYLVRAVRDGANDAEARGAMMVAANLAGIAFNHSMVGVVHGVSHALGGIFHAPHGEANAVILPHGMRFNLDTVPERFAALGRALGAGRDLSEAAAAQHAIDRVVALRAEVAEASGLPVDLPGLGVPADRDDEVAAKAMEDGSMLYNPRFVEEADVLALLEAAR